MWWLEAWLLWWVWIWPPWAREYIYFSDLYNFANGRHQGATLPRFRPLSCAWSYEQRKSSISLQRSERSCQGWSEGVVLLRPSKEAKQRLKEARWALPRTRQRLRAIEAWFPRLSLELPRMRQRHWVLKPSFFNYPWRYWGQGRGTGSWHVLAVCCTSLSEGGCGATCPSWVKKSLEDEVWQKYIWQSEGELLR